MAMFAQDELIRSFFKTEVYTIEKLDKGLTNDNYLLTVDHQRFVLRVPKSDSDRIVNYAHEAKALDIVSQAGLDVQTLYYDQNTGIKITAYMDDLKTYNEYQGQDKLERTAALMKRLHGLNASIGYAFDPIARYHQYRSYVKQPLIEDEQAFLILSAVESLQGSLILCHNDWVPGNIGFGLHKDVLIDYEYAGDNDPYFDVMSFITENDLPAEDRRRFLDAYFGHPLSKDEQARLKVYEDLHNLLWCTWACMMHESRHEQIYERIALDKLRQLHRK